jgi:hypothetical protein
MRHAGELNGLELVGRCGVQLNFRNFNELASSFTKNPVRAKRLFRPARIPIDWVQDVALAGCSQQFDPHAISVSQKRKGFDAKRGADPSATSVSAPLETPEGLGFAGLSFVSSSIGSAV